MSNKQNFSAVTVKGRSQTDFLQVVTHEGRLQTEEADRADKCYIFEYRLIDTYVCIYICVCAWRIELPIAWFKLALFH